MSSDLGLVSVLGADAVGQPGQRRFRLFARNTWASLVMWMEKEQLAGLAEALDRTLALITEGQVLRTEARAGGNPLVEGMPADFPRYPTFDAQVGQMRLSYDEHDAFFTLLLTPLGMSQEEGQEPEITMAEDEQITLAFNQQQAQDLSTAIQVVISSGRPVCPLCHAPLDGGPHACVKQNGHRDVTPIEELNNGDEPEA
ncbi:hypothetical protein KDA_12950 [Dictyobacter alpinus]|uniref:DUF3090 family protein n=1 Tax=Dictyobacter alpinus TaxID=2014873 RepID=A0A402B384_9CHLR|nr:DUF3090 family protein [Dictyobacter alpinus]GCE25811.1 hypothetical protein KDA_12950 [Dictyobacter alpinus]